jgi:outer membrane receptor protein involved in Fe transport
MLQDTGVRDIKDLQILVPGLTVTSTQNEAITTARIRGIGTVGDNVGLESSVGVVIDGVYRPRNSVGFGDLGELERIEVLKGPQGTLFGKNTSAGVINVVTRNPDYTQSAEGEVTVGNYGALGVVSAGTTTPLGDYAAFRIYAAKRNRDGWMDVRTGAGPRTEDRRLRPELPHLARQAAAGADRQRGDRPVRRLAPAATRTAAPPCRLVSGSTAAIINGVGGGNAIAAVPARSVGAGGLQQPQHHAGHQGQRACGRGQLGCAWRRPVSDLDHRQARLGRGQRPRLRLQRRRPDLPNPEANESLRALQDLQPGVPPDRLHRQGRLDGGHSSTPTRTWSATRAIAWARVTSPTCRPWSARMHCLAWRPR